MMTEKETKKPYGKTIRFITLITLTLLCALIAVCGIVFSTPAGRSLFAVTGNGEIVDTPIDCVGMRNFVFKNFNTVKDSVKVTFIKGDTERITVKTDSNIINDELKTSLNGTNVTLAGSNFKRYDPTKLEITVEYLAIESITLSCDVSTDIGAVSDSVSLNFSGSVSANATLVNADNISVRLSGESEIDLAGRADTLTVESSGESEINIDNGFFIDFSLKSSGFSDLNAENITADNVTLSATGESSFSLSGRADNVKVIISGGSEIDAKNLVCKNVDLTLTGETEMTVDVTDSLKVRAGGSATVIYYGDPQIEQNISGFGNVVKGKK